MGLMSKIVKKYCPVTGSDEITVTYPNPEEMVVPRRKTKEGKYERVLKPRKQVANGLKPTFSCPQLKHPLMADLPRSFAEQLVKEKRSWCVKIEKTCPTDQIIQDLL
jgi:hypothetical protein